MSKEYEFDIFIAYHGTFSEHGSMSKAYDIYKLLTARGLKCYFFPETSNGTFEDTPSIVFTCRKFLLVANEYLLKENLQLGNGLSKEIVAVDRSMYNNWMQSGDARIYAYNALTIKMIKTIEETNAKFCSAFNGVSHFLAENGVERMDKDLIDWATGGGDASLARSSSESGPASRISADENGIYDWCMNYVSIDTSPEAASKYERYLAMFISSESGKGKYDHIDTKNLQGIIDLTIQEIKTGARLVLNVSGPRGTGKNLFLEWLYLDLYRRSKNNATFFPFYLNLEQLYYDFYESKTNEIDKYVDAKLTPMLDALFSVCTQTERSPLFIISGISRSQIKDSMEHRIKRQIDKRFRDKSYVITGIDDLIVSQEYRNCPRISFDSQRYSIMLRMVSIPRNDPEKCLDTMREYVALPGVNADADELSSSFIRLGFYSLDHFVLTLIDNDESRSANLTDLIRSYCYVTFFEGKSEDLKKRASRFAFEYAYRRTPINSLETNDLHVIHFFRHRIIVDYLIAYHYIEQFYSLDLSENDISFFEQILPKESTRFVVPMINSDEALAAKIISFVRQRYSDMQHCCQSEMHYFLGRIKNPRLKTEAKRILQEKFAEQKERVLSLRTVGQDDIQEKVALFLFRSIVVNLTYCGDNEAADQYIVNLVSSKAANEINKGFHLEYYGDKPYMPTVDALDFRDELSVGKNTISTLISDLRKTVEENCFMPYSKIALFTLCSLIQSRINVNCFDQRLLKTYAVHCIEIIKRFAHAHKIPEFPIVKSYYNMALEDLGGFASPESDEPKSSMLVRTVKLIDSLTDRPRSGWLKYNVDYPESVAEHMYGCWALGMLCLPDKYSANEHYDKETVLKILLIHDWAESVIGDIAMPLKTEADRKRESEIMKTLLLRGTYPGIADLDDLFDLWCDYEKGDSGRSFNSKIAKDIDCIQALYRFCIYYLRHPERFTPDKPKEWFRFYRTSILTPIGIDLYKELLINNPEFKPVIDLISDEHKS